MLSCIKKPMLIFSAKMHLEYARLPIYSKKKLVFVYEAWQKLYTTKPTTKELIDTHQLRRHSRNLKRILIFTILDSQGKQSKQRHKKHPTCSKEKGELSFVKLLEPANYHFSFKYGLYVKTVDSLRVIKMACK